MYLTQVYSYTKINNCFDLCFVYALSILTYMHNIFTYYSSIAHKAKKINVGLGVGH